jgi:hypothetical protein
LRIRDDLSRIWIRPFSHPGSGSKHFFIPDLGSYMKSGMQTYFFSCFLCFQEQNLCLSHSHSQKDLGSRKNSSRIRTPDQGGKKEPDRGTESAPLFRSHILEGLVPVSSYHQQQTRYRFSLTRAVPLPVFTYRYRYQYTRKEHGNLYEIFLQEFVLNRRSLSRSRNFWQAVA